LEALEFGSRIAMQLDATQRQRQRRLADKTAQHHNCIRLSG